MQVSREILNQLGGNRFIAMTGAKNFIGGDNQLTFSIPMAKRINRIRITLNAMDTYDVTFFNIRGVNLKVISEVEGAYCDMLQEIFTEATGLYTKL